MYFKDKQKTHFQEKQKKGKLEKSKKKRSETHESGVIFKWANPILLSLPLSNEAQKSFFHK